MTGRLLGYEAVLTPTGTLCEDAWIFTAALSQVTKRLKFLVAFRPGFISAAADLYEIIQIGIIGYVPGEPQAPDVPQLAPRGFRT